MDVYDKCPKCPFRIGSHTSLESLRCNLLKYDDIKGSLNKDEIMCLLKANWITKEQARNAITEIYGK